MLSQVPTTMKCMASLVIMYCYLMHMHSITGAIKDSLLQEYEIAQFLIAILNSREDYKEWENLNQLGDSSCYGDAMPSRSHHNKRQYASDHTQVNVARTAIISA